MMRIVINPDTWNRVRSHLLPQQPDTEQAAFLMGLFNEREDVIRVTQDHLATRRDFVAQEIDFLELSDLARSSLIKRAHDLHGCLIELHSHPGHSIATFSTADFAGLQETVPHMLWRLKGQPYTAVVVADSSFDALTWYPGTSSPACVEGIDVGSCILAPTNLSIWRWQ